MNLNSKPFSVGPTVRWLFLFAGVTFIASSLAGLIASAHYGVPPELASWVEHLRLERLRPLHVLLAIMAQVAGAMAIHQALIRGMQADPKSESARLWDWVALASIVGFTLFSSAQILAGKGSGREYAPWPLYLTPMLLGAVGICSIQWLRRLSVIFASSPEGAVLLSVGWILTTLGFLESQSFALPWVWGNAVRDLTSQWHGIDTFVAGINVLLYGGMIVLLQPYPKPLRKGWLFAIAGFGLLGTFGHHHYVSPQPLFLKYFAFLASMVAVLSFVRHVQGFRKQHSAGGMADQPLLKLLLAAEFWTLVAVGSGVLFAIPQLNFYVHGTFLIVAHAMGSMVGINFVIIVAAGLFFCHFDPGGSRASIRWGLPMLNGALILFWVGAVVPSGIKASMRSDAPYQVYQPLIDSWLWVFPFAGLILFSAVFVLGSELIWSASKTPVSGSGT